MRPAAFVNGVDGNIVLTSPGGPGLAPLGDYGGPTQTMAILPGSPALGAGTAVAGITTDQRGDPLDSPPDIGAFQSQGFTISTVAGTTPQQTTDGIPFANPLAVVVTANDPIEPVAGGVVTFTASSPGSQAALSAGTATIGADGSASVIACDDSIAGSYTVSAGIPGAVPVTFSLTNLASTPVFDYTVNSTSGGISGSGTSGTLAYVQFLANADAAPHTEPTVISFDPAVFSDGGDDHPGRHVDALGDVGPGGDRRARGRAPDGQRRRCRQRIPGGERRHGHPLGHDDHGGRGRLAPSGLVGLYDTATTTLDDCTISGNSAARRSCGDRRSRTTRRRRRSTAARSSATPP